jgi:tetratricopeptide (TPR) repeat protein
VERGKSTAEALLAGGSYGRARARLNRYLWLHPRDPHAHLLMAEALIRDDSLPADHSVGAAIGHLQCIPDESSQGAEARIREARLEFLIRKRPVRAERLLRRAIEQEPGSFEAHAMLWKVFDLTGRADLTEPIFWRCYELAPAHKRGALLRDWYLSQFAPGSASEPLDRRMGFVGPGEEWSRFVELRRLIEFRNTEPAAPQAHAAIAQWFLLRQNDAEQAIEAFRAATAAELPFGEPLYVARLTEACLHLGWHEHAAESFAQWSAPRDGYYYWKTRGMVDEEVHHDFPSAVEAYGRAILVWPGECDWSTRFRLANCLMRLGKETQAAEVRARALTLQPLMEPSLHQHLREVLTEFDRAGSLEDLARFYENLGRLGEADCWRREIERRGSLSRSSIPGPFSGTARPFFDAPSGPTPPP